VPRERPPIEVWQELRRIVWERDNKKCVHCGIEVKFEEFHCDHIKSGKNATNEINNLRTLCRKCHVLRDDKRHKGMIAKALKDGIIPPDWRKLVWSG
jgi:5-methylcytosine-specific restriction endonuclease McrA